MPLNIDDKSLFMASEDLNERLSCLVGQVFEILGK